MPNTVPPKWPAKIPCKMAFVAEAPSDEEMIDLEPLVGPSGRVFNGLLRAANIDRKDVLITNVFDTKAPGNDVEPWMRDPAIFNPALTRLEKEIAKADPTVIVPLGGPAFWAFTGETGISGFRGNVMQATVVGKGRKIVPTMHPAHVMRQWKFWTVVLGDIIRAAAEAEIGPQIVYPPKRLYIEPALAEVVEACALCKASKNGPVSVDIETGWGQITCIGVSPDAEWGMCIPFVDFRKPNRSYWAKAKDEVAAWTALKDLLESPVPKLGQNYGAYDAYWILDKMGIRTMNLCEDTRLLHHALYPELPKDLAFLGASYSKQGAWKHMGWRAKRDD